MTRGAAHCHRRSHRWATLAVALAAIGEAACGGAKLEQGAKVPETGLRVVNPLAVQRMASGVRAARDPKMQAEAIVRLREALEIAPDLWEARFDLGIVLANVGDLTSAEEQLKTASSAAPDREEVAVALAEVRRRRGQIKDAAGALEEFVTKHSDALDARTLLVASLRDSGQHDKALAQAREVLVRKPGDAGALAELALCHLGKGERDIAELLVKQSLDVNPKGATARRVQGLVQLASGDDAAAFQAFSKAAQEDPQDTISRLNMGVVLLRAGSYAKAIEQYKSALAVSPDEPAAQIGLAAALRGASGGKDPKMLEEARSLLDKVLERDPHNITALFNMGVLQADSLKKPSDAKKYFERFMDEAPRAHPSRVEAERFLWGAKNATPTETSQQAPAPSLRGTP